MRLTILQTKMARSALGLVDGRKQSYRNYYAASVGGSAESSWNDLVSQGYAKRGNPSSKLVGFCLTDEGAQVVLLPGESLDPEDFPGRAALAQSVEKK